MKREKRLTKREKKALDPSFRPGPRNKNTHIHCIACGRHIDPSELSGSPPTALMITCDHGSRFASCIGCLDHSQQLVDQHDKSGQPVKAAGAWH
jgi:hypothetical protein